MQLDVAAQEAALTALKKEQFSLYAKGDYKFLLELNRDAVMSILHAMRLALPEGWYMDLDVREQIAPTGRHVVVTARLQIFAAGQVLFAATDVGEGVLTPVDTRTGEESVAENQVRSAATRAIKRVLEHAAPSVAELTMQYSRWAERYCWDNKLFPLPAEYKARMETERQVRKAMLEGVLGKVGNGTTSHSDALFPISDTATRPARKR